MVPAETRRKEATRRISISMYLDVSVLIRNEEEKQ